MTAATEHHGRLLGNAALNIRNAIANRDRCIRQAHADGMSPAAIAEAVGLSRQQVWRIVRAT